MKMIFAAVGFTWLLIGVAFAFGVSWAWTAMLVAAIGTLWFLPFGTLPGIIQIALLLWLRKLPR